LLANGANFDRGRRAPLICDRFDAGRRAVDEGGVLFRGELFFLALASISTEGEHPLSFAFILTEGAIFTTVTTTS